jgi:hypothetical protein
VPGTENILCPKCRQNGDLNPAGAVKDDTKQYRVYIISCDKHGQFEYVGDLGLLSMDATKKANLAGLKRHAKMSFNLGLLGLAKGITKAKQFLDEQLK